jgi:hypothetical protein
MLSDASSLLRIPSADRSHIFTDARVSCTSRRVEDETADDGSCVPTSRKRDRRFLVVGQPETPATIVARWRPALSHGLLHVQQETAWTRTVDHTRPTINFINGFPKILPAPTALICRLHFRSACTTCTTRTTCLADEV